MSSHYFPLGIWDIFNPRSRINRMTYFMYGAVLEIFRITIAYIVATAASIAPDVFNASPIATLAVSLALLAIYLYGRFCITAKRVHDIGLPAVLAAIAICIVTVYLATDYVDILPGWTSLIATVLFWVNLAIHIALLFVPGTKGPNRYGEKALAPKRYKAHVLEG